MTLPSLLLIGAMKSGTTSLYADLDTQPGIQFCDPKEPGDLARDAVLTPAGRASYERYFRSCPPGTIAGDASTIYAKLPEFPGVPERACQLLPDDFKVLYIVRDPVSRAISQHFHELSDKPRAIPHDPDEALRTIPRFTDYSRYFMQIQPWRAAIGDARIRIVIFEEFIKSRRDTIAELSRWLGIEPRPELIDEGLVHNKGEARVVAPGPLKKFQQSQAYIRYIRPMLAPETRRRVLSWFSPTPPPRPAPPSAETIDRLIDALRPDADRLAEYLGRSEPIWDFEGVRAKHAQQRPSSSSATDPGAPAASTRAAT
ncbi:MAG: sulfotransferase [Phycisphaerales bacterium]